MNRRDQGVVAGLVIALVVLAVAIALPPSAPSPAASESTPSPGSPAPSPAVVAYREGRLGRPASVSPFGAHSQADRDLVALVFSGLVRLGPGREVLPDLASSWTVTPDGTTWTFTLRADAEWHDGVPVTADDVAFTILTLQDPAYVGPGGSSWRDVTVSVVNERTVRFELTTPLGDFLQVAIQPIAPAHLLEGVKPEVIMNGPFGQQPIGSGPFRLISWNAGEAILEPVASALAAGSPSPGLSPSPSPGVSSSPSPAASPPRAASSHSAAASPSTAGSTSPGASPSRRPTPSPSSVASPSPGLTMPEGDVIPRLEIRYFVEPADLVAAFEAGDIDAAVDLPPATAVELAADTASHLLRYPRSTLTTIILDLRPGHPELRDVRAREALLGSLDRDTIVTEVLAGVGTRADAPIPPSTWPFDPAGSPPLQFDAAAATKKLTEAGWKKVEDRWRAPNGSQPYKLEMLAPEEAANPFAWAAARRAAADWASIGLDVDVIPLTPTDLVDRLRERDFQAAIVDVEIGRDPDLYPLLASTQATSSGSNLAGVQDATLDGLLEAARKPGTDAARSPAWRALQDYLTSTRPILPIYFRDLPVVLEKGVEGVDVRALGDPSDRFWDVLTWRLAAAG